MMLRVWSVDSLAVRECVQGWAQLKEGAECDENKAFMMTTCPASCGVCSELQKHLAATKKDEL